MMEIVAPKAKEPGYSPDYYISSSEVPAGRPYPYMIWQNAIHLNVHELFKAVKTGDTIADIKEGLSAGLWTIGIIEDSSIWGLSLEETKNLSDDEYSRKNRIIQKKYYEAETHFTAQTINEVSEILEFIDEQIESGQRPKPRIV